MSANFVIHAEDCDKVYQRRLSNKVINKCAFPNMSPAHIFTSQKTINDIEFPELSNEEFLNKLVKERGVLPIPYEQVIKLQPIFDKIRIQLKTSGGNGFQIRTQGTSDDVVIDLTESDIDVLVNICGYGLVDISGKYYPAGTYNFSW